MTYQLRCLKCMGEVPYIVKEEEFYITVKNEDFLIKGKRAFCKNDGEELLHLDYDKENQEKAFNLYREKYGIVRVDELKEARENYQLTQREYSYLLGFGEITVSRYERGSLPTVAQSNIIHESFNPTYFYKTIPEKHEKISNQRLIEIKENIRMLEPQPQIIIDRLANRIQSEMTEGVNFNKFSEMVYEFAKKSEPPITKLNKLLFYADFYHYKHYGISISGIPYVRLQYGPVPKSYSLLYELVPTIQRVETEMGEKICIKEENIQSLYLSKTEKETIQFVYLQFKTFNEKQISNYSFEEIAWKEIENYAVIPYVYAEYLTI